MTGEKSLNTLRRGHRNLNKPQKVEGLPMKFYAPYRFECLDGMPPDGEGGVFLGFDADYNPCLLRWSENVDGGWMGLAFGPPEGTPAAFLPNKEGAQQVVRFAFLPTIVAKEDIG